MRPTNLLGNLNFHCANASTQYAGDSSVCPNSFSHVSTRPSIHPTPVTSRRNSLCVCFTSCTLASQYEVEYTHTSLAPAPSVDLTIRNETSTPTFTPFCDRINQGGTARLSAGWRSTTRANSGMHPIGILRSAYIHPAVGGT